MVVIVKEGFYFSKGSVNAQEMLGCFSGEKYSWNSGQSLSFQRYYLVEGCFPITLLCPRVKGRMQNIIHLPSTNVTRGAEARLGNSEVKAEV